MILISSRNFHFAFVLVFLFNVKIPISVIGSIIKKCSALILTTNYTKKNCLFYLKTRNFSYEIAIEMGCFNE